MKKLLLLLLLIPALLGAQTKEEKKAQEKARKEAVANLKKELRNYKNWWWSGDIHQNNVENSKKIVLNTGNYFVLSLICVKSESINNQVGYMISIELPKSYLPNYNGSLDGKKTLQVVCRIEGGKKFTTKLYSDNDPYFWLFKPEKVKTSNGSTIDLTSSLISAGKLYLEFQTSEFSEHDGAYKYLEFDLSGASNLFEKVRSVLLV